MRWDRATAYFDEISIDLGKPPQREKPELPEEQALREIMQSELNKLKEKRRSKHG